MHIYSEFDVIPRSLRDKPGPVALTIGNFDGVHLGHQQVLSQLRETAHAHEATSVVITFEPHPAVIHHPESAPELLTGRGEKLARIQDWVDVLVELNYTEELAANTAEEFVLRYFVDPFDLAAVVVGHDVRFGRGNEGDFATMVELGKRYGFDVIGVDDFPVMSNGFDQTVSRCSSTAIRAALAEGDVTAAARMLGTLHTVAGEVVHGEARGRELGFPTANLSQQSEGMVPADGVYAGWVTDWEGTQWPAAISVGTNPTFDGVKRVVEAHVLDRPDEPVERFDLYGQRIKVEFLARLRGMVAYEGVEKLVTQMHQDVAEARRVLCGAPASADLPES